MISSDDGLTLIEVTNDDLVVGAFTFPDGVTRIGNRAFRGCSELTQLTLPAGITRIGNAAFWDCSGLTKLVLPEGVEDIGYNAFWNCCGLTQLVLSAGLESIGYGAFYGCSGLTQLTLSAGVTYIDNSTFSGCSSLTQLTLSAGLTSVNKFAFYDCTNLEVILIHAKTVEDYKRIKGLLPEPLREKAAHSETLVSEVGMFGASPAAKTCGDEHHTKTDLDGLREKYAIALQQYEALLVEHGGGAAAGEAPELVVARDRVEALEKAMAEEPSAKRACLGF